MHWFWRAAIAVVAGILSGVITAVGSLPLLREIGPDRPLAILSLFCLYVPPPVVALAVYGYLTRRQMVLETETRCRKCGYILRGISEPRCPECGERI